MADGRKHGGGKTRTGSTERGVDRTDQARERKELTRTVRPPSGLIGVPRRSETMAGSKSGAQWRLWRLRTADQYSGMLAPPPAASHEPPLASLADSSRIIQVGTFQRGTD